MKATHLPFAVVGDPQGDRYVVAPQDRQDMTQLQALARAADEHFYCASRLGGCGSQVTPVNGLKRRSHFRHYPKAHCQLRDTEEERDRFTHRRIQDAIVAWLRGLGYSSNPERWLDRRSRVDIFCEPNAVIEIQLSGETIDSHASRTVRYGDNITWLFGDARHLTARDALLQEFGLVQMVRLAHESLQRLPTAGDLPPVEIGLQMRLEDGGPTRTDWFPLQTCTFDPAVGLRVPGFSTIAESVQRASQEAAARRRPRTISIRRTPTPIELARNSVAMPGPRPRVFNLEMMAAWETHFGLRYTRGGPWHQTIAKSDPETLRTFTSWIDGRWQTGLPDHLVDPAWALLYRTTRDPSGPIDWLIDRSFDPQGSILHRMNACRLIRLYEIPTPIYVALHDLRFLGTTEPWHQPPEFL